MENALPASAPKQASLVTRFCLELLYLLWYSFLYPSRLATLMQTFHPDLTPQTGFSQQLGLSYHSPAVRRFFGLQLAIWLLVGIFSALLFLSAWAALSPVSLTSEDMAFAMAFGIAGSVMVGIAFLAAGGVASSLTFDVTIGVTFSLAAGIAIGRANDIFGSLAIGLACGLSAGVAGSVFDHLQRSIFNLSRLSSWGRSILGSALFGLAIVLAVNIAGLVPGSVAVGLALGLTVSIAGGLDMFIRERRLHWHALKWMIIDGLVLGITGRIALDWSGVAGNLVFGVTVGAFFGLLIGAGGISMRAGNGVSATLAMAGLTWLLVTSSIADVSMLLSLGIATITLLAGLYGYVRLPLYLLEVFWTVWLYRRAKSQPEKARSRLRHSPVYWDELIFYPLPLLDRLLLLSLRTDHTAGLQEAAFIARSFRQGWAANQARLAFAAEMLAKCNSPAMIASAPTELEWLADQVMIELQQGTGEIVPRLMAIAQGVKANLQADNPYSRRLGYREALDALDLLQQRLPYLGAQPLQRWQPVIDRWQQILLDALDNVLATTAFVTTTENPYQPGNPLQLTRKELFKGRKELRDAVVNALLERNRPTLVLQGPRRMGKTSFLLQLPALLPGQTLPVFLDLQRPTFTQSTSAFLFHIARTISRDARPYRLLIEPPQRIAFDEAPFEAFATWLEDVALPALQGFNLLLALDEFEKLGEAVEAGRLDIRIFDELRYLIQHQTRLALLFAGVQTLDELGADWSSYFINIKPLTISYLNPIEAEALIRQPDSAADFRLSYDEAVVASIIAQTHCQPYLLQLVCSAIVEEANAQARLDINAAVLEAALVRALDQGEPYFRNIWDEMAGPEGQPVLRQLALKEEGLILPDSPVLAHMARRRVITRNGETYRIEVPLVHRWVRERAPQT